MFFFSAFKRFISVSFTVLLSVSIGFLVGDMRKVFVNGADGIVSAVSVPEVFAQGSKDVDPGSDAGCDAGCDGCSDGCGP